MHSEDPAYIFEAINQNSNKNRHLEQTAFYPLSDILVGDVGMVLTPSHASGHPVPGVISSIEPPFIQVVEGAGDKVRPVKSGTASDYVYFGKNIPEMTFHTCFQEDYRNDHKPSHGSHSVSEPPETYPDERTHKGHYRAAAGGAQYNYEHCKHASNTVNFPRKRRL